VLSVSRQNHRRQTQPTQVLVLEGVERSPFTLRISKNQYIRCSTHVDRHTGAARQADGRHLRDVLRGLHVRSVATGSEDDSDLGVGVDVVGRDEGTGRIVDEGGKLTRDVLMSDLQWYKGEIHVRVA